MKKILSLVLVMIMLVSIVPTVFAEDTDYVNGTQVVYTADTDTDGDGVSDAEYYEVTVPALLAPGESGNVTATGTWASDRKLVVTSDETVTLTNSISGGDEKVLGVSFDGIELNGSNTAAVSETVEVSVDNITNALFGTWTGAFEYNVEMQDVQ